MTDLRHVVVVGGGLGGLRTVEALRREGFDGRLTLVGEEQDAPYDRPPLSKEVLTGKRAPATLYLTSVERLAELDVDLSLGCRASGLDLTHRHVMLADGSALAFDGLIVATGSAPRAHALLSGRSDVYTLRTLADAMLLKGALERAQHVTVVGAGFIGSEVASSARSLDCEVTIVELEERPLAHAVGHQMGVLLMDLHRDNGTEVRLGATVEAMADGSSHRLTLSDGSVLETDMVVVGIGGVTNVAWLAGSGLTVDRGIVCDADLSCGPPGVYAVGDVAIWPNELFGLRMRVEHWTNAAEQARHAVRNLLHRTATPFRGSNYVWSDQYGARIQFVGQRGDNLEIIAGRVDAREFLAWYRDGDRLVGAMAIGMPQELMKTKQLIEQAHSWHEAVGLWEQAT